MKQRRQQHSVLPYKQGDGACHGKQFVTTAKGGVVCRCQFADDAAHLVRVANAHPVLVDAVQEAVRFLAANDFSVTAHLEETLRTALRAARAEIPVLINPLDHAA